MPRSIKLEKKAKRGTLLKLIAQVGKVVLERQMSAGENGVLKRGVRDTRVVCDNAQEAKVQYQKLVEQARADGFGGPARPKKKTPKARKAPSARRRTK